VPVTDEPRREAGCIVGRDGNPIPATALLRAARGSFCLLAALAVLSCREVPIWTSAPVPLLQAIAEGRTALVGEWVESGMDLDAPRPLADAGPAAAERLDGGTARPLELAVALDRHEMALFLVRAGAAIGAMAGRLLCLTALEGTPADVEFLHARGVPVDPAAPCVPDSGTVADLAARNSDEMVSTIAALGAVPRE